jgi:hypothetical protein
MVQTRDSVGPTRPPIDARKMKNSWSFSGEGGGCRDDYHGLATNPACDFYFAAKIRTLGRTIDATHGWAIGSGIFEA